MPPPELRHAVKCVVIIGEAGGVVWRWRMAAHLTIIKPYSYKGFLASSGALMCEVTDKVSTFQDIIQLTASCSPGEVECVVKPAPVLPRGLEF